MCTMIVQRLVLVFVGLDPTGILHLDSNTLCTCGFVKWSKHVARMVFLSLIQLMGVVAQGVPLNYCHHGGSYILNKLS